MTTIYPARPLTVSVGRLVRTAAGRTEPVLDDAGLLDLARSAIGIPVLWSFMLGAFGYGFAGGSLVAAAVNTTAAALFVMTLQSLTVPLIVFPVRLLRAAGSREAGRLAEAVLVLAAGGGLVAANAALAYPFAKECLLGIGAAAVIYGFGVSLSRLPRLRPNDSVAPQLGRLTTPFLAGPIWFVATYLVLCLADVFDLGSGLTALSAALLG